MSDRRAWFVGGGSGPWRVVRNERVTGPVPLAGCERLVVHSATAPVSPPESRWVLSGVTSNLRYTERAEREQLNAKQEALGRPQATCAAMIPIRKSAAWWDLPQDDRRALLETQSRHIAVGLNYLPAIARRLYHCRDLGEPFDFITWFEYAPEHATAFEELVGLLRSSPEWNYVDAEVDLRLTRDAGL